MKTRGTKKKIIVNRQVDVPKTFLTDIDAWDISNDIPEDMKIKKHKLCKTKDNTCRV